MKTESILSGKIAMITGWGTGLAILFLFFSSKVDISPSVLKVVDISLTLCVIVFTFLSFMAVYGGFPDIKREPPHPPSSHPSKRIQGWAFSIALLLFGYYILDIAPEIKGATRTATVLGACMAGLGTVVLYRSVTRLMIRKKT